MELSCAFQVQNLMFFLNKSVANLGFLELDCISLVFRTPGLNLDHKSCDGTKQLHRLQRQLSNLRNQK